MPDLLARIDAIMAELAELRAELAASEGVHIVHTPSGNGLDADEPDGPWQDATSVAAELGVPIDTVRYAARHKSIGRKRAGVWEINLPLARRWFRCG